MAHVRFTLIASLCLHVLLGCPSQVDDDAGDDDVSDDDAGDDDGGDDDASDDDVGDDDAGDDDGSDDDVGDDDVGDDDTGDDDAGDDDTAPPPPINPDVVSMDDVVDPALVVVEPDRLTLPLAGHESLQKLTGDNLLVSGDGVGYLRRVDQVSLSGPDLVIDTLDATVVEAVNDGALATPIDLVNGGTPAARFTDAPLDVGGTVLHQDPDLSVTLIQGLVEFNPALTVEIDVVGAGVDRIAVGGIGTMDVELAAQVVASTAASASGSTVLWQQDRAYVQLIDWFPVVVVARTSLVAGYTVAAAEPVDMTFGASGDAALDGGVLVQNQTVTPSSSCTTGPVTRLGPALPTPGELVAEVWLEPLVELRVYDAPGIEIRGHAAVQASTPALDPACGFTVDSQWGFEVQGDLAKLEPGLAVPPQSLHDWLGAVASPLDLPDYEAQCCDRDFLLTDWSDPAPVGCSTVGGDLVIDSAVIDDLSFLQGVEVVQGNLVVTGNHVLPDLSGLDDLNHIDGDWVTCGNDALTSMELPSLTSVGGDLVIGYDANWCWDIDNPMLTDLAFGWNLNNLSGSLVIEQTDALLSTSGIPSLTWIGGSIRVRNNTGLTELVLAGLLDLYGTIDVVANASLETIHFGVLETCGGIDLASQYLTANPLLQYVQFPFLTTVNGDVDLGEMGLMSHVDGFWSLETIHGDLKLTDTAGPVEIEFWSLHTVDGTVSVSESQTVMSLQDLDLGSLQTAHSVSIGLPTISALDLGSLSSTAADTSIGGCDLSSLDLGNLQSVGGTFSVGYMPLTSLGILSLGSVGDNFTVTETDLATLEPLSLSSVGDHIWVRHNPYLDRCDICAWAVPLGATCFDQYGNDDSNYPACP